MGERERSALKEDHHPKCAVEVSGRSPDVFCTCGKWRRSIGLGPSAIEASKPEDFCQCYKPCACMMGHCCTCGKFVGCAHNEPAPALPTSEKP